MHTIPTLIIGGGVAGSSLACALAEQGAGDGVCLADVDVFGKFSSSELNGGGVRCTFADPLNVELSLRSARYYLQHADTFDFHQRGYLWMYDEALWDSARAFLPVVRRFGLPVEELTPAQLRQRYPLLTGDLSDLAGATLTPFDGRLNPHKLRIHYLNRAQAGGVEILDRWQVVGVEGDAAPYHVTLRRVNPRSVRTTLSDGLAAPRSAAPAPPKQELHVQCHRVVNAAGPWAPEIARLYGDTLPIAPVPRQVFLLHHDEVDLEPWPFFIDYPQDLYFRHYHRDGRDGVLVSWSDPDEPSGINFAFREEAYYRRHVRPRLVRRMPLLAAATLIGGWAGHYELSPDKTAVVGAVPGRPGLFNYNGLSAHGVMQSRALGEALAGLLGRGAWDPALDLSRLSAARFSAATAAEAMYV